MAEVLGGPAESPGTPGEHVPARDDAGARRLWQLSEELTGLTPARPGI